MKKIIHFLFIIFCSIASSSSKSNSLTQENAEKSIREFLTTHSLKTTELEISPTTIIKIGKTNVYSESHTCVKVDFNISNNQSLTLLFDFSRKPKNRWFLRSVEEVDVPLQELTNWLKANKSVNITAQ